MREMGLAGAGRGGAWTTTTQPALNAVRRGDLVDRHFTATRPNQLWVSDFTFAT
jgi:putative transposase